MESETLLDTGPLVGFLDRSDQWHGFGLEVFQKTPFPAYTCEAVISEAAFLLRHSPAGREALLELVGLGALVVLPLFPAATSYLRDFLRRYGDRADLADAALMYLAENFPSARVVTTDHEAFAAYRWLRRRGHPPFWSPQNPP